MCKIILYIRQSANYISGYIDAIIQGRDRNFPAQVQTIVHNMAVAFVDNLAGMLRERRIDLRIGQTVFVGGGSILLRRYIETCKKINSHIFVEDIAANVKDYELMYRIWLQRFE